MGRKKTYDRDTLINQSMELFRDHGYAGTSTQMLVDDLGVNRYSLYAEFGDKQSLFDAALERYRQEVIEPRFEPLTTDTAGLAEIRALFEFYGSPAARYAAGRGCLLCNTAIELGPGDPSGAGFVPRYLDHLARAFRHALEQAQARGELVDHVDPPAEAEFLTAAVLGLFVMLRASAAEAVVSGAARAATAHIDTLSMRVPD